MPVKHHSRLILFFIVLVLAFSIVKPVYAQDGLRVYYAGADGSVKTALELAKFELVTDAALADVFVLNGEIPDIELIRGRVGQGAGLVLFLGPTLTEEQVGGVLGIPLTLTVQEDAVSLTNIDLDDPLLTEIIWNGAPQIRERFDVVTPLSSVQPLVTSYENGEWILWQARPNEFVVTAFMGGANSQIQEWAYFNYLIYHLVKRAAGESPLSFAAYPVSPVPHAGDRVILFGLLGLIVVTTFTVFFLVRRYSLSHPEALDQIVSD